MIEQRVTLRYDAQQIPAIVQAVQGDTGRDVIFELADYEIPAGATANYYIDKPDGNAVYNSAEVISSTEILAHLTEQALAVPGRNNGQVRILSDGDVITSFDFVLEVEVFRGILHLQSETEVNIFDAAIQAAVDNAIEEIRAQTPVVTGMQNSIAPTYSSSSTYAVGDYVMYNAQLYKCNTAITTAEAWTAAHWTQVSIASDVSDLKSSFKQTEQYKYDNLIPAFELGDISATTGKPVDSTTNLRTSDFIKVKPSTSYIFNIAGNKKGVLSGIVFYYRDNKQLISYSNQFSYTPFTTPSNAYYCKFVLPTVYGTTYNSDVVFSEENGIHKNAEFVNMLSHYLADNLLGTLEVGDISGTGVPVSGSTTLRTKDFIEVAESDKYILFIDSLANSSCGFIYYYRANKTFLSLAAVQNKTAITIPTNACYCKFVFSSTYGTTDLGDIYFAHFGGSTKTIQRLYEYIPFLGKNSLGYSYEVGDIDASTGANQPGSTTLRTANMVSVHAGSNYLIISSSAVNPLGFLYYYAANKSFLGYRQIPNTREFEAIENAAYMRVVLSSQYGTTFNHDLMFVEKYGGAYNPYDNSENKLPIIVAKDGSGDFTSLTEACSTAASGQTIYVKHGVYEDEEVDAMNKTLYIIGEDTQTTIIKNQTGNYYRPPIEIGAGLLKNLTIFEDSVSTDGRGAYAVHIDTDYSENKDFTIENCILKSRAQSAIGFGMRGGCTFTFKNSEFYSETGYGIFANDALPEQPMGNMALKVIGCTIYSNKHEHEPMLICSWRGEDNRTDCVFQHNVVTNVDNSPVCWFFNQTDPRAGEATEVGNLHGLIGWYNSVLSYGNNYEELNYHAQTE